MILKFVSWATQHGNDRNERVFMQFRSSVDGVRFGALQNLNLCFFMLISRWFVMHFGVILHDFVHPSASLISIYEWSSEQLKTRDFYHFLKRFLYGKNTITRNVSWIFWKIRQKLGRKKLIHFRAISTQYSVFWIFHATSKKTWYAGRFVSSRNII